MSTPVILPNSEQFARIMGDIGEAIPEMAHVFETELIDSDEAREGIFARVLQGGVVQVGDAVIVLDAAGAS